MSSTLAVTPPPQQAALDAIDQWKHADAPFAAALDAGIPRASALAAFGLRLCQQQQPAEAARVFHAALAFRPADTRLWNDLAVALERAAGSGAGAGGVSEQAHSCVQQSLALDPAQPDAQLLLGGMKKRKGDLAGAEAAYLRALEFDPQSYLAWQCLSLVKQDRHDYAAALEALLACVRFGGATPAVEGNLGRLYFQLGRFAEAAKAYAQALRGDSANTHYRQTLRKTLFLVNLIDGQSVDAALQAFRDDDRSESQPRDILGLLKEAYLLLGGFKHLAAAAAVARKQVELSPLDPSAEYLLQAATGGRQKPDDPSCVRQVDRSPPHYVLETFERFADQFEQVLVGVLGYRVPEKLCAQLVKSLEPGRLYDTLDAGCGTGLCGPLLRVASRRLVGVDLAPKMLAQAAKKQIYDQLVCEELVEFLRRSPGAFDLVVAADVLIYIGDMAPLFSAVAGALHPAGLFAFSTETLDTGRFQLLPTGRFAQSNDYIREMAAEFFEECSCTPTTLRTEGTAPLAGNLFVFRRRTPSNVTQDSPGNSL